MCWKCITVNVFDLFLLNESKLKLFCGTPQQCGIQQMLSTDVKVNNPALVHRNKLLHTSMFLSIKLVLAAFHMSCLYHNIFKFVILVDICSKDVD